MSANQKIPKGPLAIAVFFILLFFIEVIVVASVTPNMPPVFWAIGVTFLILGIIIYIYLYRKFKSGAYVAKSVQEAVVSGEEQLVTDEEMRSGFKKSIVLFIIGWIMAAASAPFLYTVVQSGQLTMVGFTFAMGVAFGLIGTYFIITYKTKPERYREILTKRKKRKMKKKK